MIKITLDTNCVINLLNFNAETPTSVDELSEIIKYGLDSNANIAITTRVESECEGDKNKERSKEMIRKIQMLPVIGTVARWNTSKWDGGDVWGGQEHEKLSDELTKIIFPALKKEDAHYKNKINDIDHLVGHIINKRDIFVTDDAQILKKSETLKASLNLTVMSPKQALEYLNSRGDKTILVQDFYDKFLEQKKLILKFLTSEKDLELLDKYEENRQWLIRKYPNIKDGLGDFKVQQMSVPMGGQRAFTQIDIVSLQFFNKKLNALLVERNPLNIPDIISNNPDSYAVVYLSEEEKLGKTISFLNKIEDLLLGYLGKLEGK
ncbi:MAG: hypothetical protein WCT29_00680 [Candidatus Paceibacterota bacterium]|jgi:hypothetical protein